MESSEPLVSSTSRVSWSWFAEYLERFSISQREDLLKFIARAHCINVTDDDIRQINSFDPNPRRDKFWNVIKRGISSTNPLYVRRFLDLDEKLLSAYQTWLESSPDVRKQLVVDAPDDYSLPILALTVQELQISPESIAPDYLRRVIYFANQPPEKLVQCLRVAANCCEKRDLIKFLATCVYYPPVEYDKLPYAKFRGSEVKIDNYEDLLAAGWIRDRHLYHDHPFMYYLDPIRDPLHFEPRVGVQGYTPDEIRQLAYPFESRIDSSWRNLLNEAHDSYIGPLLAEDYGCETEITQTTITPDTPGVRFDGRPVLVSELISCFTIHGLCDPWTLNPLTGKQINQLYACNFEELSKLMYELNAQVQDQKLQLNLFLSQVAEDSMKRDQAIEFFHGVFEFSMYLRNWDGIGPYPLQQTGGGDIDPFLIAPCERFRNLLDKYDRMSKLPIYLYQKNRRSYDFQISKRPENGFTIRDRFEILHQDKLQSCRVITSNWYISTAYYYLSLIENPLPFEIEEVRFLQDLKARSRSYG
jgi:hypothetical protein